MVRMAHPTVFLCHFANQVPVGLQKVFELRFFAKP